jgi:hypothetical protein
VAKKKPQPSSDTDLVHSQGSVPTVELSDKALLGVGKHLLTADNQENLQSHTSVRLGRKRPPSRPSVPRLAAYFSPATATVQPPTQLDYYTKAANSLVRIYLNNQYGCCVISGKAHSFGIWSANDKDSGGIILATDQEIYSQYQSVCGPGDNGCIISSVLDYCKGQGFLAGGKRYKIDGYVAVDWRDKLQVQVAQVLFGACTIGINLPQAWTSNNTWDVTNSRIVGGHDVTVCGYSGQGVYVSSWGRLYLMTWAAFTSTKWVEEYYAMLSPSWYGIDKMAPSGVDAAALLDDLSRLGRGDLPPLPDPVTPPPPPPLGRERTLVVKADGTWLVDGKVV